MDAIVVAPRNKKKKFGVERIVVYFFLVIFALYFLVPLYIMLVTSLKDMSEIRAGNILALPKEITFYAWDKAWNSSCSGAVCEGISVGFWNSVKIVVPSTIISVLLAAITGYALALWKVRWGNMLLSALMLGAFVPYQILLYPLVKLMAFAGLYGSLPGVILVHVLFGLPIHTLIFRNYYMSLPSDLMKAALIDTGDFFRIFFHIILPMSSSILIVSTILQVTAIWNDYLIGLTFAGLDNLPMTVMLNNIVNSTFGVKEYNVDMAVTMITAMLPLVVYFGSGKFFVRGITNGAVKG
ncbi:carbohydrate ABC transporter permease [Vibrio sp. VB16]|uniref:carbohydrate ABC transporter permease n=1 Tax=Vibrio sp. VB16 TaxID=2785746 RepID=UPI00189FD38F|nr:carbohydrate ABC transporter permease [Vibrio sp. VB16]UGA56964.1 carbohydrate ABC transporter permease [Vibrio sp. VB16]